MRLCDASRRPSSRRRRSAPLSSPSRASTSAYRRVARIDCPWPTSARTVLTGNLRRGGPRSDARSHEYPEGSGMSGRTLAATGTISSSRCYGRVSRSAGSPSAASSLARSPTDADRPASDVCRPGGDRHRERAPVQGAGGAQPRPDRGAGAADGDQRGPRVISQLADRPAARARPIATQHACASARRRDLVSRAATCYAASGFLQRGASQMLSEGSSAPSASAGTRTSARPESRSQRGTIATFRRRVRASIPITARAAELDRRPQRAGVPAVARGRPAGCHRSCEPKSSHSPTSKSRCSRPSPTRR